MEGNLVLRGLWLKITINTLRQTCYSVMKVLIYMRLLKKLSDNLYERLKSNGFIIMPLNLFVTNWTCLNAAAPKDMDNILHYTCDTAAVGTCSLRHCSVYNSTSKYKSSLLNSESKELELCIEFVILTFVLYLL